MIRALVLVSLLALPLGGCSKTQSADAPIGAATGAASASKPNPWSSGGAVPPGVDPKAAAAPGPAAAAADASAAAASSAALKRNPWAKDGDAGSAPPPPTAQPAVK